MSSAADDDFQEVEEELEIEEDAAVRVQALVRGHLLRQARKRLQQGPDTQAETETKAENGVEAGPAGRVSYSAAVRGHPEVPPRRSTARVGQTVAAAKRVDAAFAAFLLALAWVLFVQPGIGLLRPPFFFVRWVTGPLWRRLVPGGSVGGGDDNTLSEDPGASGD